MAHHTLFLDRDVVDKLLSYVAERHYVNLPTTAIDGHISWCSMSLYNTGIVLDDMVYITDHGNRVAITLRVVAISEIKINPDSDLLTVTIYKLFKR